MLNKRLTRRELLKLAGVAAGSAVLSACAPAEPEVAPEEVVVKETVVVEGTPEVVEKVVTATSPPEAPGRKTLRFWDNYGDEDPKSQILINQVFEQFKHLADRKKEVFDEDLEAIVGQVLDEAENARTWELATLQTTGGTGVLPTATVQLRNRQSGELVTDAATGDGPVDAAFTCIHRLTGLSASLREYDLRAITGGRDAQGEVHLEIEANGQSYRGRGRSTDVIEASALAMLNAVNRALTAAGKPAPEPTNGKV